MKRLPPNARRFLQEHPSAGLWVAIGPDAWQFSKQKPFPVLVLPPGESPTDFRWPQIGAAATIFETGPANDQLLTSVAACLIDAGAPFIAAVRESLLTDRTACVFFYNDSVPRHD